MYSRSAFAKFFDNVSFCDFILNSQLNNRRTHIWTAALVDAKRPGRLYEIHKKNTYISICNGSFNWFGGNRRAGTTTHRHACYCPTGHRQTVLRLSTLLESLVQSLLQQPLFL